ncbi:hypothetical protein D3C72_800330 [compost metagenome]
MAADRAGEARGENHLFARLVVHRCDQGNAIRQFQRGLERFGQTLLQIGANLEAVDDHIDRVLFLFIQFWQFIEFADAAVDPGANETLGAQLFENRKVFTFTLANHRRQQHQFAAFRLRQHQVDHLADGLRLQWNIVIRAARNADACIQQAQVVVDFGDGADGRTRVVRGRLLFDGDRRRQAFDGVDVGLFHHRQELPGVGR